MYKLSDVSLSNACELVLWRHLEQTMSSTSKKEWDTSFGISRLAFICDFIQGSTITYMESVFGFQGLNRK